jgi:uncharacterized DUF497 family protein
MEYKNFEWDERKNRRNISKHGISFEQAIEVFDDVYALKLFDESHSDYEERFYLIGRDLRERELTVCHCYRGKNDDIIRIISARKANENEIEFYWRNKS